MRAVVAIALVVLASPLAGQYQTHTQLDAAIRQLATRAGNRGELVTVATSPGGRVVRALRLGAAGRPALLVIAGAHGPHLVSSSIAMAAAERLLGSSALDSTTVWFIPRLNPDAAEAMFASVPWARTANDGRRDDDRDQASDEDGMDDLNGDGIIAQLRLADPDGAWIADSADPRLLRRADAAKGEVGRWTVVSEGRDDDGDGEYNEDGPGGIDVNRSFSYDYPHHGREAGSFPFEAPEARGVAEFLMAHEEVAAIYVVGPQDNLLRPWENRPNAGIMNPETRERAQEGTSAGGPLNSILRADQATFADIGRRFQDITDLTRAPTAAGLGGDVLSWGYFHFGRWAFGSRGWWAPEAPRDTTARPGGGGAARSGASTGGAATDPLADERSALKWFDAQGIDAFAPWTAVTLGGRERRSGEVGGFRPGALLNPPAGAELDSALARQARFIEALATMLPRLALHEARSERLGDGVYRVTLQLANHGALPTSTSLAGRLRIPRRVRVDVDLGGATILAGQRTQLLGPIEGGGRTTTIQWTVAAPAGTTVRFTAGAPSAGSVTHSLTLR